MIKQSIGYSAIPFIVTPQQLQESMRKNNGIVIVSGVIQRADSLNQNKRKYPKQILLREVERYNSDFIKQGNALGELDHPDCVLPDTKILTKDGWKYIKDISEDEIVATLNTVTNELEYQQIVRKIEQHYAGEMIEFKNAVFSACVTPNHKFYVMRGVDRQRGEFIAANELYKTDVINKKCKWQGTDQLVMTFPATGIKESYSVDTEAFCNFLGWYIAEGYISQYKGNMVYISQSKKEGKEQIIAMLDQMPYHWNYYVGKNDEWVFYIIDKALYEYLKPLGGSYDKHIPQEIKNLSPKYLKILLRSLMLGDGTTNGNDYYTVSPQLASDVSEIIIKCGLSASITEIDRIDNYYVIKNKETGEIETINNIYWYTKPKYAIKENFEIVDKIKKKNGKIMYIIRTKDSSHYFFNEMDKTIIDYDGMVYCVEVPNHTIYLMRDGKQFWSGNSSIVELKNASHRILEVWWSGDDLLGKIEILHDVTPAGHILYKLFERGIKVGISSRGLGSVKPINEDGAVEVQDDFELVAWDFVSNPSTQGAYMTMLHEGIDPANMNLHKFMKMESIINSILRGE